VCLETLETATLSAERSFATLHRSIVWDLNLTHSQTTHTHTRALCRVHIIITIIIRVVSFFFLVTRKGHDFGGRELLVGKSVLGAVARTTTFRRTAECTRVMSIIHCTTRLWVLLQYVTHERGWCAAILSYATQDWGRQFVLCYYYSLSCEHIIILCCAVYAATCNSRANVGYSSS